MKYELKALSFGDTLGTAFNMYIDNFVVLFLICMVLNIPLIFFTGNITNLTVSAYTSENYIPFLSGYVIFLIATILLSAIQTGLIINYVAHKYLGKEINIKDFIYKMKSCLLPLIGLSFLVLLSAMLGVIALVIPGVILYYGLILSTQVLIIERKGIIESMKRSWSLTKGKKMQIFGMLFIIGLITTALNQISNLIMESILKSIGLVGVWIGAFLSFFVASLTSPLQACVIVLVYFNSRIEKEGFALEHLANQFLPGEDEESAGTGQ